MAVLKYKNSNGEYVALMSPIVDVQQTTGTSTTAIMSQKAVTDELKKTLTTDSLKISSGYTDIPDSEVGSNGDLILKGGESYDLAFKKTQKGIIDNEYVVSKALAEIRSSVGLNYNLEFVPNSSLKYISGATSVSNALEILDNTLSYIGVNKVTSIGSITATKRLCIVEATANGSLSTYLAPPVGDELHIIVHNASSSNITVTVPNNDSNFISFVDGATITIASGGYAEINIVNDGTNRYVRAVS